MHRRTTNVARERFDLLYKVFAIVVVVVASCSVLLTIFFWGALHEAGDEVRAVICAPMICVMNAGTVMNGRCLRACVRVAHMQNCAQSCRSVLTCATVS